MQRTELLTDTELAALGTYQDRALGRALATGPTDRVAGEAAVRRAYTAAGLPEPELIVWMDSPGGGLYAAGILAQGSSGPGPSQLSRRLWHQLWDQLSVKRWKQLNSRMGDRLWDSPQRLFERELVDRLEVQVGTQLELEVRMQINDYLRDQYGLTHQLHNVWDTIYWLLLRDFSDEFTVDTSRKITRPSGIYSALRTLASYPFYRQLGARYADDSNDLLDALMDTCDLGWWWPYHHWAILTDRPVKLYRDRQANPHHETGPAITYADGWSVCAWRGITVPADLIEGRWSVARILAENRMGIRRSAIAKMGWDRFIAEAALGQIGPTVPDPSDPRQVLTLYDAPQLRYEDGARVLLCTNATPEPDGTHRRFGIVVPADIRDPLAAAAWTFDLFPDQYAQLTPAHQSGADPVTPTLGHLIDKHGIQVSAHLDRSQQLRVSTGLQRQGNIAIIPARMTYTNRYAIHPVPARGIAVEPGLNIGHAHVLLASGDVCYDAADLVVSYHDIGVLTVASDATAYLAHDKHGYTAIGPGTYLLRQQRKRGENAE
jgi:hypothetical protein